MFRPTTRSLIGTPEHPEIVFRRTYRAAPSEIMDACTDVGRLARWFGAIDGSPAAVGDPFTAQLSEDPDDLATGEVLACGDDELTVSWTWQGEAVSTITARVRPVDDGTTELTLHHAFAEPDHAAGYGGGWEQVLQALARALGVPTADGGSAEIPSDDEIEAHAFRSWRELVASPVEIVQDVAAPREHVWKAMTTASGLASWWWDHWEGIEYQVDARPGGRYRIAAPSRGITVSGTFLSVEEPAHLAYSWTWEDAEGSSADEAVDVHLEQNTDGTCIRVRHSGPWAPDAPQAEDYRQGWEYTLTRLAQALGPAEN